MSSKDKSSSDSKVEPEAPVDAIDQEFVAVLGALTAFRSRVTVLQNQVRTLEKSVARRIRLLRREAKKNKNKGNRKPSGFAVPTKITDELCDFMNKPRGTEVARTEVTQYIIQYIKDNDLQWAENRKIIKPDGALESLLDVGNGDEVTYFNLQRYMNRHFVKTNKKVATYK